MHGLFWVLGYTNPNDLFWKVNKYCWLHITQKNKNKNWFDLKYVQIIKSKHLNEENEQGMLQFNLTTYIDMKRHMLMDCCRSDGDDHSILKGFLNIWKNGHIISNGYSSDLTKIDQKYCCFVVHGIFGSNICITWFQCCQGPYDGCCMVNGIVGLSAFDQVGFQLDFLSTIR